MKATINNVTTSQPVGKFFARLLGLSDLARFPFLGQPAFAMSAARVPAPVKIRQHFGALILAAAVLSSPLANAASAWWDNSGGTANDWGSIANWSDSVDGGTNPASIPGNATTDLATFSITSLLGTVQTVNLNAARSLGELSFNNTAAISLLAGGTNRTLTLAGISGVGITKAGTGAVTIGSATAGQQVAIALSANQSWINNDNTGAINVLNGVSSNSTTVGRTLTLDGTSTAANTISGVIANNSSGIMTLTKNGTGTWVLSGTNTYTGVTTINDGTLSVGTIGNGGVAGNMGNATNAAGNLVLGGGTLQYTGSTASSNRSFTLTAGTSSTIEVTTNTLTISGNSTNTNGALTKTGAGTLTLSGANLYTGLTTVSEGTLAYGVSNALSSGAVTVSGGMLDIVSFSDTVGAVTLSSGSITGTTGVLTGTSYSLTDTGSVSARLAGAVALTKTGAGTATLSGVNTYTGNTTVTAGTLAPTLATALPGYNTSGKVVFNGGTLSTIMGDGSTTGWSTTQVNNLLSSATKTSGALGIDTTNADLTQWVAFTTTNFGSTLGLAKLGANTLTLNQSNTFAGQLSVQEGTLSIASINNASASGVLGNSANSVILGNTGGLTGTLSYTGGTASSTKKFTMGAGGTGAFNVTAAGTTLTLSGVIDGSGGLTKTGGGTLILSGANTYSGNTIVASGGGTLTLSGSGTFGTGSVTSSGGTIDLGGKSITNYMGTLTGGGAVNNGTITNDGGQWTVQNGTVGAKLSGNNSLLKNSGSTVTLSGANTYIGETMVTGGTLVVNNADALSGSTVYLNPGGALITFNGTGGTYNIGGLRGNNTTVPFDNNGNLLSIGANNINTNYSGVMSGTGGLTKVGAGGMTLNGASTYTGTTTVSASSLVAAANALSGSVGPFGNATSAIVLGNGSTAAGDAPSLLINGAYTVGRNMTVGSVSNTAAYNATIGGSNTTGTAIYTGNITLNTTATNYTATLQAATDGTVEFKTGTWTTNNKAIAIGSSGNTGTVQLSNTISTTGGISVNYGTLTLNSAFTGNMTVASGTTLGGNGSVSGTTGVTGGTVNGSGLTLTGVTTFNSTGNTMSGTVTSTNGVTLASGAALANNGALTGSLAVGNGTLTGTSGSVSGATTLSGGTINLTSGTLGSTLGVTGGNWNGAGSVTGAVTSSSGTFNIGSGANLIANGGLAVTGGAISAGNASSTITGSLNYTSSTSSSFGGVIAGNGTVTLGNAASLSLTGNNSFTGSTTVSSGTLGLANSSGAALGATSGIAVNSGGTLLLSQSNQINNSATMTLGGGTVKFGSTVSEGSSSAVGVGALTLTASSAIDFNSLAGTITFSTYTPGGFTLAVNNWVNTSSHLIFNQDQTANIAANAFTINSLTTVGQTSLGGGFYELTAVPEPGTIAAGLALLGLVAWRERKRLASIVRPRRNIAGGPEGNIIS